jgi:hypothetical protein
VPRFLVDAPRQHIGDGLDAAVWMPWKPRAIILRTIVAEVVEQQEWIELAGITEAESAVPSMASSRKRTLRGQNHHVHSACEAHYSVQAIEGAGVKLRRWVSYGKGQDRGHCRQQSPRKKAQR